MHFSYVIELRLIMSHRILRVNINVTRINRISSVRAMLLILYEISLVKSEFLNRDCK